MPIHLDTDFLVYALSEAGPERQKLLELATSGEVIELSAVAWYEFTRGPRTPDQVGRARSLFQQDGIIPFSESIAAEAAEAFRRLGSPRRRAADVAIGVTAVARGATLITRNVRDFAGIAGLEVTDGRESLH